MEAVKLTARHYGGSAGGCPKNSLILFLFFTLSTFTVRAEDFRDNYECGRYKYLQEKLENGKPDGPVSKWLSELYLSKGRCALDNEEDRENSLSISVSLGNYEGAVGLALERFKKGKTRNGLELLGLAENGSDVRFSRMAKEYAAYAIIGMKETQDIYGHNYDDLREVSLKILMDIAEGPLDSGPDLDFSMSAMRANYYLSLYNDGSGIEQRRKYQNRGDEFQNAIFGKIKKDCTIIFYLLASSGIGYDKEKFFNRCL